MLPKLSEIRLYFRLCLFIALIEVRQSDDRSKFLCKSWQNTKHVISTFTLPVSRLSKTLDFLKY